MFTEQLPAVFKKMLFLFFLFVVLVLKFVAINMPKIMPDKIFLKQLVIVVVAFFVNDALGKLCISPDMGW